jgi:hypothetical protein
MNEENGVTPQSPEEKVETVVEETPATPASESVITPPTAPQKPVEKVVPYERFKEVNDELSRLKTQGTNTKALEVDDFINISASLEGLDQAQKEYLAEQHRLTGKPLGEIRNSENFSLWNSGYQNKVEREKALKPNGTQGEADKPKSLVDKLNELGAGGIRNNLGEMEKELEKRGLYRSPRNNMHRTSIQK